MDFTISEYINYIIYFIVHQVDVLKYIYIF